MANPTPIYRVQYNSQYLPGYVQSDDRPLSMSNVVSTPFGRDGAYVKKTGTKLRPITLSFLVKSRLNNISTGIQQLEYSMDQYREALQIVTRVTAESQLQIHDADRFYMATVDEVSLPMTAGRTNSLVYTVRWQAQPWAISTTTPSTSFSTTGDKVVTNVVLDAARRSYVILTINSGVTALVATDDWGHTIDFTRGAFTGDITVNTADMTIETAGGVNAVASLNDLNFGMFYDDNTGSFTLHVATYTGSGTYTVAVTPRYEM
jgi:hypothetical protein